MWCTVVMRLNSWQELVNRSIHRVLTDDDGGEKRMDGSLNPHPRHCSLRMYVTASLADWARASPIGKTDN